MSEQQFDQEAGNTMTEHTPEVDPRIAKLRESLSVSSEFTPGDTILWDEVTHKVVTALVSDDRDGLSARYVRSGLANEQYVDNSFLDIDDAPMTTVVNRRGINRVSYVNRQFEVTQFFAARLGGDGYWHITGKRIDEANRKVTFDLLVSEYLQAPGVSNVAVVTETASL